MPTFDFQCRACQHIFEFTRSFGSSAKPSCPTCSSKRVEKLIAPPAVHFKGAGWYKTDSRVTSGTKVPPKNEEKKSEDVKTDVKPAESKTSEKKEESATTKGTRETKATQEKQKR